MTATGLSRRDAWIALAILALAFVFFALRVHSVIDTVFNSTVFGTDHDENLVALHDHRYWGLGYAKHFGAVVWAFATIWPQQLVGISAATAATISFSFWLGLGHGAQYLALRSERFPPLACVAMVLLSASAYAYLTAAAAIDIYGMAVAGIWIGLAVTRLLAPRFSGWRGMIVAAAGAGIGGVINVPATAYALVQTEERPDFRRAAIITAIALAIGAAPLVVLGAFSGYSQQRNVIEQWASLGHFSDIAILRDYLISAISSLVPPGDAIICRYTWADVAGFGGSFARLAALAGWVGLIGWGLVSGLTQPETRWRTISACAPVGVILLFYIYFAPQAILLFSVQCLPGLILLIAPLAARSRIGLGLVAATLLLSFAVNLPMLSTLPGRDKMAGCPAELRVNGGL